MVYVGFYFKWFIDECVLFSDEVSNILKFDNYVVFFLEMYGNKFNNWLDKFKGNEWLCFIVNVCMCMCFVYIDGIFDFDNKFYFSVVFYSISSMLKLWFEVENKKFGDD